MSNAIDLSGAPIPIAAAREFVRDRLDRCRTIPQTEEAVWAASELVVCAVVHRLTDITLVVDLTGSGVRLELRDSQARPLRVADVPLIFEVR
ncbi:MAG TPA: hypothetical protein VFH70_13295 [Acidimicrobiales bacterium]|nr:hypothetical protein [Acidimicrobiales bacterium]